MRGEDAAILAPARLRLRLEHDRAGAVAEQDAGGAIGPVEDARIGLRPDHQGTLEAAAAQETVRDREAVDEARAHRLQVEGGAMRDAEPGLDRDRAGRKRVVRGGGGEHDEIDRLRLDPGGGKRGLRRLEPHVGGDLAGRRDVALADAGALDDPLVAGVDLAGELLVGEDALRQVAAAAEHDRTRDGHEAAPPICPDVAGAAHILVEGVG